MLYILLRSFVTRKLQPVSTAVIVPKVPAGWLEHGIVIGLDVFDGAVDEGIDGAVDEDIDGAGSNGVDDEEAVNSAAVEGSRASCIATPINPPTSPAMAAMNSPAKARIHSRFFGACVATCTAFASVDVR